MTMDEIVRQESRIKEARGLYGKAKKLKGAYDEICRSESKINNFRITFMHDGNQVVTIFGDDVKKSFVKWLVRNMAESIEDHIAVIERDISEI